MLQPSSCSRLSEQQQSSPEEICSTPWCYMAGQFLERGDTSSAVSLQGRCSLDLCTAAHGHFTWLVHKATRPRTRSRAHEPTSVCFLKLNKGQPPARCKTSLEIKVFGNTGHSSIWGINISNVPPRHTSSTKPCKTNGNICPTSLGLLSQQQETRSQLPEESNKNWQ